VYSYFICYAVGYNMHALTTGHM